MDLTTNAKIQKYMNEVCSHIRFHDIHEEIRLELKTHLEALVEEYIEDGFSEKEGISKAIAQMGSADTVGEQLDIIHRPKPDWSLLALSFVLINAGIVAIYFMEKYSWSSPFPIFTKSLFYTLIGGVAVIGLYFFDYRKLEEHSLKIYGGTILALVGTSIFGVSVNGQQIYLVIGPLSINIFSISPIFFSIALAGIFQKWNWNQPKKLLQGLLLYLLPFMLLVSGSLSSAVIYAITCITLAIASGAKPKSLLMLGGLLTSVMIWLIASSPYRMGRFMSYIHPSLDPLGSGWLQNQLRNLISSSGFLGKGLTMEPSTIPDLHTDFIFSYITFSFGWIAGGCLAAFIILFIFRMTRITSLVKDRYARALVMGFAAIFSVQFIWNILMNLGLAPIGGVGLPFISFGGSQLVFNGAALGLISSIYKRRNISGTNHSL